MFEPLQVYCILMHYKTANNVHPNWKITIKQLGTRLRVNGLLRCNFNCLNENWVPFLWEQLSHFHFPSKDLKGRVCPVEQILSFKRRASFESAAPSYVEILPAIQLFAFRLNQNFGKRSHGNTKRINRSSYAPIKFWTRGYKTFFMLNLIEHEIFPAYKC